MNHEEFQSVMKYAPYLMFDEKEPFSVYNIGYMIFHETGLSDSFRRIVRIHKEKVKFAIEYQIFFYYDIQHLYELEHVWVYVGHDGNVCGCEGSYHGKYMNEMLPGGDILRDRTHVCLYSQPGKHALLPEKRLISLYPELELVCGELAGADGFAYPEQLYGVKIPITEDEQQMVRDYIKENYSFTPSMVFVAKPFSFSQFLPWKILKGQIPILLEKELDKIRRVTEDKKQQMMADLR